jgi:hypothetical protein
MIRFFMSVTEKLFPEKRRDVLVIVSLSAVVTRRIDDIGDITLSCLKHKRQSFTKFSLAVDENTDTCDTARLFTRVSQIKTLKIFLNLIY